MRDRVTSFQPTESYMAADPHHRIKETDQQNRTQRSRLEQSSVVGFGTQGQVVIHPKNPRWVQKNFFLYHLDDDTQFGNHPVYEPFFRETVILNLLKGTGLVPEIIPEETRLSPYQASVTMERFPMNLRELYQQHRLTFPQKEVIFLQCWSKLQTLHRMGLIHGDVKPENILVRPLKDSSAPQSTASTSQSTASSEEYHVVFADWALVLLGRQPQQITWTPQTIIYRAPESWELQVSSRIDLYSLGLLGLELFLDFTIADDLHQGTNVYHQLASMGYLQGEPFVNLDTSKIQERHQRWQQLPTWWQQQLLALIHPNPEKRVLLPGGPQSNDLCQSGPLLQDHFHNLQSTKFHPLDPDIEDVKMYRTMIDRVFIRKNLSDHPVLPLTPRQETSLDRLIPQWLVLPWQPTDRIFGWQWFMILYRVHCQPGEYCFQRQPSQTFLDRMLTLAQQPEWLCYHLAHLEHIGS